MLHHGIWGASQPTGIVGDVRPFLNLTPLLGRVLNLDDFVCFQTDRDNPPRTNVGTAPALPAAPELKADVKLVARRLSGRLTFIGKLLTRGGVCTAVPIM